MIEEVPLSLCVGNEKIRKTVVVVIAPSGAFRRSDIECGSAVGQLNEIAAIILVEIVPLAFRPAAIRNKKIEVTVEIKVAPCRASRMIVTLTLGPRVIFSN